MKIISHKGFWVKESEQNTLIAFERALKEGLGIEIDVRDHNKRLVISHDLPIGHEVLLEECLNLYSKRSGSYPLAINVKSNGLAPYIKKNMEAFSNLDWFVFDMSVPDTISYINLKIPFFARMSEEERNAQWTKSAKGIWLDSFFSSWYNADVVNSLLNLELKVCVVSPELHQREPIPLWKNLKENISNKDKLMLCTDFPQQARVFFKEDIV